MSRDVAEGWVTPERAREVYGVVVDQRGNIDLDATLAAGMRRPSSDGM